MDISDYDQLRPVEAIALQRTLQKRTDLRPLEKEVRIIAGADISFNRFSEVVYAGIIVLRFPELEVLEEATVVTQATFPYIPGLLSFREIPALMACWDRLKAKPDVLVMDGHGIAHPRRIGIATHFGIVAQVPTIGCGKSRLSGTFEEPGPAPFDQSALIHKEEQIGTVLRTKKRCKPLFISPGNLITMKESVTIITQCVGKYRIPEPTRRAHLLVNRIRLEAVNKP
ncbi:MAG: deoxyribonuclease V [Sphingobacteriales bacterium]|nr:MAG: deoxyribonuclease V [Sphingobacteriales bacterium]